MPSDATGSYITDHLMPMMAPDRAGGGAASTASDCAPARQVFLPVAAAPTALQREQLAAGLAWPAAAASIPHHLLHSPTHVAGHPPGVHLGLDSGDACDDAVQVHSMHRLPAAGAGAVGSAAACVREGAAGGVAQGSAGLWDGHQRQGHLHHVDILSGNEWESMHIT